MQLLLWPLSKGLCEDEIPGHVVTFSKLDEALHKYKMMVFFFIIGDKIRNEDWSKVDREGFDCNTKVSLFLFP